MFDTRTVCKWSSSICIALIALAWSSLTAGKCFHPVYYNFNSYMHNINYIYKKNKWKSWSCQCPWETKHTWSTRQDSGSLWHWSKQAGQVPWSQTLSKLWWRNWLDLLVHIGTCGLARSYTGVVTLELLVSVSRDITVIYWVSLQMACQGPSYNDDTFPSPKYHNWGAA